MKRLIFYCFIIGMSVLVASCNKLKEGASGNKKYDSLFLGISLGMDEKAFFDYCWELNKQKLVTHGPTNQSVEYVLATELDHPVRMQFYPVFYNHKIVDMPVTYTYSSWAPWNKEYGSEVLLKNMLVLYKKWYGEEFKSLNHPTMGTIHYKMDGKRRINLFIRDDQYVEAVFTDLELEEERKASMKENTK